MFTPDFLKYYPLPWRIQGAEVVDNEGCHVIAFEADTPEDREFWENVVTAVNAAIQRELLSETVPPPVADFCKQVADEIERAAMLHPGPNPNLAALMEEVGEVGKALLEARQSVAEIGTVTTEDWENIRMEAVQVATMAFRIVFEGDPTMSVVP